MIKNKSSKKKIAFLICLMIAFSQVPGMCSLYTLMRLNVCFDSFTKYDWAKEELRNLAGIKEDVYEKENAKKYEFIKLVHKVIGVD